MAFDYFSWAIENWYLPRKAEDSRKRAEPDKAFHRPLPKLGQVGPDGKLPLRLAEVINLQCQRLGYTPDPLWGADDYYTHPELTQYRLESGRTDIPCDCDDYAVYAYALARKCGMSYSHGWIWNLIIDPAKQVSQAWANHVVVAFSIGSDTQPWVGVIDTNSAAQGKPIWFQGTPESVEQRVLAHFGGVYKVSYYKLLRVPYPF